ncbi:MAG: LptF/LptG family permease [Deltaproteobacteria bacterium]|jgi:lipopolysaccharide export system permease protein|nr:LptF/LptG family permease [Deltaproteobacteria bacterium]
MFSTIIKRRILSETIPSFVVNLLVFTFILLMARVMSLADLVVQGGVAATDIAFIFLLIMPKMLSMSIPMAALLAPLTTFLRMSADCEITVLKASGVSLYQLLPPVVSFGLAALALTGFFNLYLGPIANVKFRTELLLLAKARADLAIKEQVFVRDFTGLTIYVGQLSADSKGAMLNVVINDRRLEGENTFVAAERGQLDIDREAGLLLFSLERGVIDRFSKGSPSVDSIFFETYELKISPGSEFASEENSLVWGRSDFPTSELMAESLRRRDAGKTNWRYYQIEYHTRHALPFAAFVMSLVGMPLGASFRTRGKNFGLIIALTIFVLYYSVLTFATTLAGAGIAPVGPAIWTANVISAIVAVVLLKSLNRSAAIDPKATWRRLAKRFRAGWGNAGEERR